MKKNALLTAFRLYGMMPADRCNVTVPSNAQLGVMAQVRKAAMSSSFSFV